MDEDVSERPSQQKTRHKANNDMVDQVVSRSRSKGKQRAYDDEVASTRRPQQKGKQRAISDTITAAGVIALQSQARSYALANAFAEKEAEILSVQDRQDALAASTRKHYARHQKHWIVSSLEVA